MITLVMSREIRQRLRSKSFAVTTVLLCVGIIGLGFLNRVLSDDDKPPTSKVAVVGDLPLGFDETAQQTAQALDIVVRFVSPVSRSVAELGVREGDFDVAVDTSTGEVISNSAPSDRLTATLNAAWQSSSSRQAALDAGLDSVEIASILSPAALDSVLLDGEVRTDDTLARVVGSAAAILLFISVNAFGGMVLTGVVEEKSTGVVEVLLAHVRPYQLLTGKVFGIGAVALIQFGAAVMTGLAALSISGSVVPGAVWIGLPSALLWFIFGFVLYSTLFALAGSFVSRQEDATGASAPISMLFSAAYLTVFILGANPAALTTRFVSILPPFSPLLMPLRISVGAASVVEIVLAAVLLIAATFGMLHLAGAVYGRTLLHRGARLKWTEAVRMRSS